MSSKFPARRLVNHHHHRLVVISLKNRPSTTYRTTILSFDHYSAHDFTIILNTSSNILLPTYKCNPGDKMSYDEVET